MRKNIVTPVAVGSQPYPETLVAWGFKGSDKFLVLAAVNHYIVAVWASYQTKKTQAGKETYIVAHDPTLGVVGQGKNLKEAEKSLMHGICCEIEQNIELLGISTYLDRLEIEKKFEVTRYKKLKSLAVNVQIALGRAT